MVNNFDPDEYLGETEKFDPNKYLSQFDPDEYLGEKPSLLTRITEPLAKPLYRLAEEIGKVTAYPEPVKQLAKPIPQEIPKLAWIPPERPKVPPKEPEIKPYIPELYPEAEVELTPEQESIITKSFRRWSDREFEKRGGRLKTPEEQPFRRGEEIVMFTAGGLVGGGVGRIGGLVPSVLGQIAERSPAFGQWVMRHKGLAGLLSQAISGSIAGVSAKIPEKSVSRAALEGAIWQTAWTTIVGGLPAFVKLLRGRGISIPPQVINELKTLPKESPPEIKPEIVVPPEPVKLPTIPVKPPEVPIKEAIPPVTTPIPTELVKPTVPEVKPEITTVITEPIVEPKTKKVTVIKDKPILLKEIEKAIQSAPTREEAKQQEQIYEKKFKTDGNFYIFNTKEALQTFYKAVKTTPAVETEHIPSVPKLRPIATKQEYIEPIGVVEGYFSDGKILIKGVPDPKLKIDEKRKFTIEAIKEILNTPTKLAKLEYYYVDQLGVKGVSDTPINKMVTPDGVPIEDQRVLFKVDDKFVNYDQGRYNVIRNRFPDATYGVSKNGTLIAYRGEEPVAALMPMKISDEVPLFLNERPLSDMVKEISPETKKKIVTEHYDKLPLEAKIPKPVFHPTTDVKPQDREFVDQLSTITDVDLNRDKLIKFARILGANVAEKQRKMPPGVVGRQQDLLTAEDRIRTSYINDLHTLSHEVGHQLHTFLSNAGENMQDFVKDNIEEFMNVSQYVRPIIGEFTPHQLAYRKSWQELFADYLSAYLYYPEKARELGPGITKEMDELMTMYKLNDAVVDLRRIDDITTKSPIDIGKFIQDNFNMVKGTISDVGERVCNLIGTPFYRAVNHSAFAPVMNAVVDNMIYRKAGMGKDLLEALNMEQFQQLPKNSRDRIVEAFYKGNLPNIKTRFTDIQLKTTFNMNRIEIDEYKRIANYLDKVTDNYIEYAKWTAGYYLPDIAPEIQEEIVNQIQSRLQRLGGYFPIQRDSMGKYKLWAETEEGIGWFNTYKTEEEARRMENSLKQAGYVETEVYKKGQIAREALRRWSRLPSMDLATLLESEGIKKSDPAVKQILTMFERGKVPYFLRREYIPGYPQTEENFVSSLVNFGETSIRLLTKTITRRQGTQALAKIDAKKDPNTYNYASMYLDDAFLIDRNEGVNFSRFIYFYFLAWNVKFAIINGVQPLMMTKPWLINEIGWLKGNKAFIDAYAKIATRNYEPELENIINRAEKEGLLNPIFTKEALSKLRKPETMIETISETGGKIIGVLTSLTEQVNRKHALISGYTVGKQKGLSDEDLYNYVKKTVNATQLIYGKYNLPEFVRQSGILYPIVKAGYTFTTFPASYLSELIYLTKTGRVTSKTDAWLTLLLLSGLLGLPGGMMLHKLIRKKTKKDPYVEMRMKNQVFADMLWKGLPASLGVDISRSAGLGDMFNRFFSLNDAIGGAYYGMYRRWKFGIKDLQAGKTFEGLNNISPIFLSSPLEAYRMFKQIKEGKTPTLGEVGLPFIPTKSELLSRSLGFQPTRFTSFYALENYMKFLQSEKLKKTKELNERLFVAIDNGDTETEKQIKSEARKWNEELPKDLEKEMRIKLNVTAINMRRRKALGRPAYPKGIRKYRKEAVEQMFE